jgi:hypothetical protein
MQAAFSNLAVPGGCPERVLNLRQVLDRYARAPWVFTTLKHKRETSLDSRSACSLVEKEIGVSRISNESRKLEIEIMRKERCTQLKYSQFKHERCMGIGYIGDRFAL